MAKKKSKKKTDKASIEVTISLIIGIFTLIIVTIGATYSYFSVSAINQYNSTSVTTTLDSVGNVVLSNTNTDLELNLTGEDMMKQATDIAYYASSEGTTNSFNEETIGVISANGNGTFNCEYDLNISATGTNNMYTAFQNMNGKSTNQIVLTVNGTSIDFNTANLFPKTIHYTVTGLVAGANRNIVASLKIVNKESVDQTALASTDITLSFTVSNFRCSLSSS